MAIIYTYPVKGTPLAADLLLISDTADGNKSKNATIASLVTSNAIDVVDTLNSLKGDINITGGTNITVTPSGQNIEISTSASNVDGSGTAYKIPMWSDSNTLTNSPFETSSVGTGVLDIPNYIRHIGDTGCFFGFNSAVNSEFLVYTEGSGSPIDQESLRITPTGTAIKTNATTRLNTTVAGAVELYYAGAKKFETLSSGTQFTGFLDIPSYIRHIGDIDSLFGFSTNDDFIINVNSGTDQIRVRQNSIIISTDSGTKLAAGPTGVTLYSDENGSTTVSKESLLTYDSGIIVKGGTENSFARGGAVRFYNSTDSGFVGIKGPTTMSPNSNYEIILPDAVGVADQVLKLPSTIGSTPYQLEWDDAGGTPGGSTGSVQFKNSSSGFAGDSALTFSAANKTLTIGDTAQDTAGIVEIQSDESGGVLKIGGGSQAYYTSIKGSDSDTASYDIILPPSGPGGNNKILESNSLGNLIWVDTPGSDGIDSLGQIGIQTVGVASATITSAGSGYTGTPSNPQNVSLIGGNNDAVISVVNAAGNGTLTTPGTGYAAGGSYQLAAGIGQSPATYTYNLPANALWYMTIENGIITAFGP